MANEPTQAVSRIIRDRKFEDYRSLKQYFRNHNIEEVLFFGYDTTTATAAEIDPDPSDTIAYLGAEAQVYVKAEADLAALDGDSVYVTYLDDAGVVNTVETLLDDATGTDEEMPLGNENVKDTVAAVDGTFKLITLTALAGTLNQYAGKYMVCYFGDQKGTSHLINSNTAATPTILTLATASAANLAADLISIQTNPCVDVFRIRAMSCETEAPADNKIMVCDHDGSNIYAIISDGSSIAAVPRYFVPELTTDKNTRYFLGYIKASTFTHNLTANNAELGYVIHLTYTPKQKDSNVPAVEVEEIELPFQDKFEWEPCLELEPGTDVKILIHKHLDADHELLFVDYGFLEVDRLVN